MFKLLAAVSLGALLAGGETTQQTSYAPALFILLVMVVCAVLVLRYLHRRFQIVRRAVAQKFQRDPSRGPVIPDKAWKRIVSGEMGRELMKQEDR